MRTKEETVARVLKHVLTKKLPVLFAHVGWAEYYDGTEAIDGNFSWIKNHPTQNWEANAFWRRQDGYFYCGIGRGKMPQGELHVVFVARNPLNKIMQIVGIYAASAIVDTNDSWAQVR